MLPIYPVFKYSSFFVYVLYTLSSPPLPLVSYGDSFVFVLFRPDLP